jgi:N6-L-threonylcarbamoyladenine synthase
MYYLGVESSCDETSIAILKGEINSNSNSFVEYLNSFEILANSVSSQILVHQKYGGVVPEVGAREHANNIHIVYNQALADANLTHQELMTGLDKIFVTTNPGLVSALRVGLEFAKSLSFFGGLSSNKIIEVVEINHLNGHLASSFYKQDLALNSGNKKDIYPKNTDIFPNLHLLVSGGNSQIILLNNWNDKKIVGKTLDDAAGECFDKIGRMLGLKYPAGVIISQITSNSENENLINLPVGMLKNSSLDLSYSGLKTAVRYLIEKQNFKIWKYQKELKKEELEYLLNPLNQEKIEHLEFIKKICISTQYVIIKQLQNKLNLAIKEFKPKSIGLSGGVSANQVLRNTLETNFKLPLFIAPKKLTGDNGAMIALAGLGDLG